VAVTVKLSRQEVETLDLLRGGWARPVFLRRCFLDKAGSVLDHQRARDRDITK
jgi:hypothetical protein